MIMKIMLPVFEYEVKGKLLSKDDLDDYIWDDFVGFVEDADWFFGGKFEVNPDNRKECLVDIVIDTSKNDPIEGVGDLRNDLKEFADELGLDFQCTVKQISFGEENADYSQKDKGEDFHADL
jgi:hypothetical protein